MINLNYNLEYTRFYPYEAVHLQDRIISIEDKNLYDILHKNVEHKLGLHLKNAAWKEIGFKSYCRLEWDNKVTFQAKTSNGLILYIQFYDGNVHIGLSISKRNYDPNTHYLEILDFKQLKISGKIE